MLRSLFTVAGAVATLACTPGEGPAQQQTGRTNSTRSSTTAAARELPPGTLRVQRAEIMDRNGFERPMVAYTMFVPAGWQGQGGVEYNMSAQNCGITHRLNYRVTAPDNSGSLQIVPEEKWLWSNTPPVQDGCPRMNITTTKQYLEWWTQRNRPGARVMDYRPRPDLSQSSKFLEQNNPDLGMRSWLDAGEVLIAYEINGRAMRESIATVTFFIHTRFPSYTGGAPMEMLQGVTFPGFAMRMPDGQLDFKRVEALRQSIRGAPEWTSRMNQAANERAQIQARSNAVIAEQNRRGVAERSAIIAQTARDVNEIQMGTWQNTSQSMDRSQRERIEGIRGVETYNDPHYGGTVQLSNQFQHAWQLRDGTYVLTDDVNFDPNRALGIQGQRLKPIP